jgi:rSAM/selenodomain-associated transferase 1
LMKKSNLGNSSYLILDPQSPQPQRSLCALAMMTKAPRPGVSKTRLLSRLTPREAAALSACFIRDTSQNFAAISSKGGADSIAVYTPVGAEAAYEGLLHRSFRLLPQRGTSLGERLFHASQDLITVGYDSVCLVDSDSPTLPPAYLKAAITELARPGDRVVLGPASDGGYYLIGLKKSRRHLFTGIDWSTPKVFAQTIARAAEAELEVMKLPTWYDIDTPTDLRRLCSALFSNNGNYPENSTSAAYPAPYTRSYLSHLIERSDGRKLFGQTGADFSGEAQQELANNA